MKTKNKIFVVALLILFLLVPFASATVGDLIIGLGQNCVVSSVPAIGQVYSVVQIAQQVVTVATAFATGGAGGVLALGQQFALSTLINVAGEKGLAAIVGEQNAGTILQIQGYGKTLLKGSEFGDIKINGTTGVIESGSIEIKQSDGTTKKIEIQNMKFSFDEKTKISTYNFEEGGSLKAGDFKYENVEKGGIIKLDETGKLIEAEITSSAAATYVFENEKLNVLPGTEITYKDGKITVHNEGTDFKYGTTGFRCLSKDVTFIKTKDGVIVFSGNLGLPDRNIEIDVYPNSKPVLILDSQSDFDKYDGNAVWVSKDGKMFDVKGKGFEVNKEGIIIRAKQGVFKRDNDKETISGCMAKVSSDSKTYCNGQIDLNVDESQNANNPDKSTTSYEKYKIDESGENKGLPEIYYVCPTAQPSISASVIQKITGFIIGFAAAQEECSGRFLTANGIKTVQSFIENGKLYIETAELAGETSTGKTNIKSYEAEKVTMKDGTVAYRIVVTPPNEEWKKYEYYKEDGTLVAKGEDMPNWDTHQKEVTETPIDTSKLLARKGGASFNVRIDPTDLVAKAAVFANKLNPFKSFINLKTKFNNYYTFDEKAKNLFALAEKEGRMSIEKKNELQGYLDKLSNLNQIIGKYTVQEQY